MTIKNCTKLRLNLRKWLFYALKGLGVFLSELFCYLKGRDIVQ